MTATDSQPVLEHARRGWYVFACRREDKTPAVRWRERSTTDKAEIIAEWSGRAFNIGIDCGKSGLLVVDEDRPGGFADFCASIGQPVPETYTVSTGKGRHFYFTQPAACTLGNSPGPLAAFGCDVRGDGGYVIAAGSTHPTGRQYIADRPDAAPAPCPPWLSAALGSVPVQVAGSALGPLNQLGASTGWTAPDPSALALDGVPDGQRQDEALRDLVWKLHAAGLDEAATHAVWRTVVSRTPLTRSGEPWTERDFRRHWDGAARKLGDVTPLNGPVQDPSVRALPVRPLAEVAAEVDARGPRRWLARGIWPAGDYGVHGAEPKAGKTWNALDLAVSVASGTPWLGSIEIDTPGSVIVFAGEGGDGNIVRRLRAIATARDVVVDALPIWICTRAPHLSDKQELDELERRVREITPVLVVLDPLYLAARGANGADLYAMGSMLERPQRICQAAGAALLVVTHFNRARDLKGAARLTGAGPAEWGRVLLAATVVSRHTDPVTKATTVLCELEATGGEIPDQTLRIRRCVTSTDPDNLDAPLTYTVDMPDADDPQPMPAGSDLSPAATKLLAAVRAMTAPATVSQLVDHIAAHHGHGLKRPTCSTELNRLRERGLVDYLDQGAGRERLWLAAGPALGGAQ